MTFEIYRLSRRENLLVLEFGYRNDSDVAQVLRDLLAKDEGTYDLSGVYLRDPDTQLNYWPATSAGSCVCTDGLDERAVEPGQLLPLSVTFGAPEGDVDHLDVHLGSLRTFERVPIS